MSRGHPSPGRSWIFLFLCNLMWALQFTCIKLVQDQVGSVFTVWGPMALATLMLFPLVRAEWRTEAARLRKRGDTWLFLVLALIGVFPAQVLVTWGTRMSTASNAAIIMLAAPVCMAFFAFLFLRERMNAVRWISFAIGVGGVLLCSQPDLRGLDWGSGYLTGNLLVLSGAFGSAFYNSYGKKLLERYSPMEMLFYTYVAMLVILTPIVVVQERDVLARVPQFTLSTWLGLILLTVFHNYLSMVLFLQALQELEAIQAALSIYLVTFFGVPIAAVALGERLNPLAVAGGLMVLTSTLLITLWPARAKSALAVKDRS
ncbi:MAG: DMT family transporter [Acidobacteria bacterium]|nr:DMT family transporter [Acidobacteriota bacterium]MBI3279811.1 DMT family transporter [Acidobacteriota bacterium]